MQNQVEVENLGAFYKKTVFFGYIMARDGWTAKAALNYEVNTILLINFVIPLYVYHGRSRGSDNWPIILSMGCWAFGNHSRREGQEFEQLRLQNFKYPQECVEV